MENRKTLKMFFSSECGWMRDVKSNRLYFYLPAGALEDLELLEECLELLQEIIPDEEEDIH